MSISRHIRKTVEKSTFPFPLMALTAFPASDGPVSERMLLAKVIKSAAISIPPER